MDGPGQSLSSSVKWMRRRVSEGRAGLNDLYLTGSMSIPGPGQAMFSHVQCAAGPFGKQPATHFWLPHTLSHLPTPVQCSAPGRAELGKTSSWPVMKLFSKAAVFLKRKTVTVKAVFQTGVFLHRRSIWLCIF